MRYRSNIVMTALLLGLGLADFLQNTALQAVPSTSPGDYTSTTRALKYYGDDIKITYRQNLGCGACITGGYTYCFYGIEGLPYPRLTPTQICCQNSSEQTCPQISNSSYVCSNKYADKMLAKNVCPYQSQKCGGQGIAFRFSTWGDSNKVKINVTLSDGDTCYYVFNTQCGVPAFQVGGDTSGFLIESIDYTDDETTQSRVLKGQDNDENFDLFDEQSISVDIQFNKFQTETNTTNSTTNTSMQNSTKNGTQTNSSTNNGTTGNSSTPTNSTANQTQGTTGAHPGPDPPKPIAILPTNILLPRRTFTTQITNGTVVYITSQTLQTGPQASIYNPNFDKGKKSFKGGKRVDSSDATCKSRNTRVYVTALGGLNVTVPTSIANSTRILQSVPATTNYTLQLTLQADYWSSGFFNQFRMVAIIACTSIALYLII